MSTIKFIRYSYSTILWFLLWTCLLNIPAVAQQNGGFQQTLTITTTRGFTDIDSLVETLTKGVKEDKQKATLLYDWLTSYLQYDLTYDKGNPRQRNQTIQQVLDRRRAVCQGYANVYATLCNRANISCKVVYGYARTTPETSLPLEVADHAWNALLLNGRWYLADPTWDSQLFHQQKEKERSFFLTPADSFVLTHLPAHPMWQLLARAVPLDTFRQSESAVIRFLKTPATDTSVYAYRDSITSHLQLSVPEQKLRTAIRSYQHNSTTANARELTAVYLDYEGYLSDHPPLTEQADSLIAYHGKLVYLCEVASQYAKLFPNQMENCAYNRINYGVALSRRLESVPDRQTALKIVEEMEKQFKEAQQLLLSLPKNLFTEQALQSCEAYLRFCKNY